MSISISRSRPFFRPALGLACLIAASLLIGAAASRASAAGLDPEWIYAFHTTAGFAESAVSPTAVDRSDLSCGGPPGTVRSIGEGVIGTRISEFVSCFGPPVRERRGPEGRCLFYRDGEAPRTFWEFCVRRGRIVSASGNHHHPR
jgi:hypothetical protein